MADEVVCWGVVPTELRDEEWSNGKVRDGVPLLQGFTSRTKYVVKGQGIVDCTNTISRDAESGRLVFTITSAR